MMAVLLAMVAKCETHNSGENVHQVQIDMRSQV